MTFVNDETITPHVKAFQSLGVDEQLALFWFVYKAMGSSVTPAAPGAGTASDEIAEGLFNQVKAKSQEEQLQIQRDLVERKSTTIDREYGSLGDTTKLLFWYLLAQGMEHGTIIPMPFDYKLSSEAEDVLNQIKGLEFNQQITFFRDIVGPMGAEAAGGAEI